MKIYPIVLKQNKRERKKAEKLQRQGRELELIRSVVYSYGRATSCHYYMAKGGIVQCLVTRTYGGGLISAAFALH